MKSSYEVFPGAIGIALSFVLVLAGATKLEQTTAEKAIPLLEGFTLVKPGTRGEVGKVPPPARSPSMTVDASAYVKDDRVKIDLEGQVSSSPTKTGRQLLVFHPDDGAPVSITADLPFDLAKWLGDSTAARLRYSAHSTPSGNKRNLSVLAEGSGTLEYVQEYGSEPLALRLMDLEMRQGHAEESTKSPSHAFNYPIPVTIRAPDGSVTTLWQGQAAVFSTESGNRRTAVLVLVSEVAKPRAEAVYIREGATFDLQLLVVGGR